MMVYLFYKIRIHLQKKNYLTYEVNKEFKQYKKILGDKTFRIEALSEGAAPYITFFLPVGLILLGSLAPLPQICCNDYILKAAGILASLCALLITIIVFSINIYKKDIPGSESILNIFAKKKGFIPITAILMGTIMAFIILGFGNDQNLMQIIIVFILTTVCILLLFSLFKNTVQLMGKENILSLLSEDLITNHKRALEQDIKIRIMIGKFDLKLKGLGLEFNKFEDGSGFKTIYTIKNAGQIIDINIREIEKIRKAKEQPPDIITILPYEEIRSGDTVLLSQNAFDDRIKKAINNAIIIGGLKEEDGLNWGEIHQLLSSLIEQQDAYNLEKVLKSIEDVIKDYLLISQRTGQRHKYNDFLLSKYTSYLPPGPGAIRYNKLIENSFRTNNSDVIDLLLKFIERLARHACSFDNKEYYSEVLTNLARFYEYSYSHANDYDRKKILDRFRNILSFTFTKCIEELDNSSEENQQKGSYAEVYVRSLLILMKVAIHKNDYGTLEKAIDLISFKDKGECFNEAEGLVDSMKKHNKKIMSEFMFFLGSFAILIAGAWTMFLVEQRQMNIKNGIRILECINIMQGNLNDLIRLKGCYIEFSDDREKELFEAMGIDWWDYREHKNLEIFEMFDPVDWLYNYWVLLAMIAASDVENIELNEVCKFKSEKLNYSEFVGKIENFKLSSEIRKHFLDEEKLAKAKAELLKVFENYSHCVFGSI